MRLDSQPDPREDDTSHHTWQWGHREWSAAHLDVRFQEDDYHLRKGNLPTVTELDTLWCVTTKLVLVQIRVKCDRLLHLTLDLVGIKCCHGQH